MTVFGAYARYYDLLYRDKDYGAETHYVDGLLREYGESPASVLELGCGTGAHAVALARLGYTVHGVDMSADMLALAEHRWAALPDDMPRPTGSVSDLRELRVDREFDAVLALFHVISYLPENADLQAGFASAARHLGPGGLFVFDFWYGPGVLTDPPEPRERKLEDDAIIVHRSARPDVMIDRNLVDVNYHIAVTDKPTGTTETFDETHRMRYLFQPELRLLLEGAGFEVLRCSAWLTDEPATAATWNAVMVARRQGSAS
ncbi:MAG: class I SAM-dependent methyltransferase [Gammaproteobacteria bacterium]|nr:class I SAM-dependent methyltransferase [Gammaproteobacteria bacterium]